LTLFATFILNLKFTVLRQAAQALNGNTGRYS